MDRSIELNRGSKGKAHVTIIVLKLGDKSKTKLLTLNNSEVCQESLCKQCRQDEVERKRVNKKFSRKCISQIWKALINGIRVAANSSQG